MIVIKVKSVDIKELEDFLQIKEEVKIFNLELKIDRIILNK